MTFAEWERFYKNLNKAVIAYSISIKDLGKAFGKVAKMLRNDKFYNAILEANKYIEKHKKDKKK